MKRLISIGLLSLYFALSMGVNVLIHTCGEYRSIDVLPASAKDPCGCCDEISGDMCCTLVLHTFHISDDQSAVSSVTLASPIASPAEYPTADVQFAGARIPGTTFVSTSPPTPVSNTILNCVFLI